jgi:PPM family protein phosphatase
MESSSSVVLEMATRSDTGRVRPHNEDSVFVKPELGLVVLADGMGGYNAGEVASSMATTLLGSGLTAALAERSPDDPAGDGRLWAQVALAREIGCTNEVIHEAAANQPQYFGMGTTVVVALFYDDRVTIAHVGDSRLYRLREGALEVLTRDHSVLQEQVDDGIITPEQARQSKKSNNLLTRALGADPVVDADIVNKEMRPGDLYLLCSDGLTDMLSDGTIAEVLRDLGELPDRCAERLVELANENGGRDNVTVALVRVVRTKPLPRGWWVRLKGWLFGRGGR